MSTDYVPVTEIVAKTGLPADELIRRIKAGELEGERRLNQWFVRAPRTLEKAAPKQGRDARIDAYVHANKRSMLAGVLLAVFFGPIGALYGSVTKGLILILATITMALALDPVLGLVGYLFSLVATPAWVSEHNRRVRATASLLAGHD